jgi:hypothetical protein
MVALLAFSWLAAAVGRPLARAVTTVVLLVTY